MLIKKIYKNNANGQQLLSIPKKSGLSTGDYILLIKLKAEDIPEFQGLPGKLKEKLLSEQQTKPKKSFEKI